MEVDSLEFFKPTKALRVYLMLKALSGDNDISQRAISKLAGISPSVVNQYLREFEQDNLIQKESVNERDFAYPLTSKGRQKWEKTTADYLQELGKLFSLGKGELAEMLKKLQKEYKLEKVILYPANELTELLIHSLEKTEIDLLAIADEASEKQQLLGYQIINLEEAGTYEPDALIITSLNGKEEIPDKLVHLEEAKIQVLSLFPGKYT